MFGNSLGDVELNKLQIELVRRLCLSTSSICTAITSFIGEVTSDGFSINASVGSYRWKVKPEDEQWKQYMTTTLRPLVENVMKSWLMYGVAAVKVSSGTYGPQFIVLDPFLECRINFTSSETSGLRKYTAVSWNSEVDPKKRERQNKQNIVTVFYEPACDGTLTSPISTCLKDVIQMELMKMATTTAVISNASRYLVVTEQPPAVSSVERTGPLGTLTDAQVTMGALTSMSDTIDRVIQFRELERQRLEGMTSAEASQRRRDSGLKGSELMRSIFSTIPTIFSEDTDPFGVQKTLRPGQDVRRLDPLPLMHDQDKITNATLGTIHDAIGLPREFMNTGRRTVGEATIVWKRLQENVGRFQSKAAPILAEMFHEAFSMFPSEIFEVEKSRRRKVDDYFEVNFTYSPRTPVDEAWTLYQTGVVSFESYQEIALKAAGLPLSMARQGGPPPALPEGSLKKSLASRSVITRPVRSQPDVIKGKTSNLKRTIYPGKNK